MIEIRKAEIGDKESIKRIYATVVGHEAKLDETAFARLLGNGGVLVAEIDTDVVGFGGIDLSAAEQLKWLYLIPEHQSVGLGRQILERLELIAWEAGLESLHLHSAPAAVNFYLRHGYEAVAPAEQLAHDHEGLEMVKSRPYTS